LLVPVGVPYAHDRGLSRLRKVASNQKSPHYWYVARKASELKDALYHGDYGGTTSMMGSIYDWFKNLFLEFVDGLMRLLEPALTFIDDRVRDANTCWANYNEYKLRKQCGDEEFEVRSLES